MSVFEEKEAKIQSGLKMLRDLSLTSKVEKTSFLASSIAQEWLNNGYAVSQDGNRRTAAEMLTRKASNHLCWLLLPH
jgi:hypothetical protein